jgi:hydrogenase maturation protein HypF
LTEAVRLDVHGVVQGVGFRPFVVRLARRHGVAGWVRNDGGVVTIHAEAEPATLSRFLAAVETDAPPLARVDSVARLSLDPVGVSGFRVERSRDGAGNRLVPPDAATCAACLSELFDPTDRRYRYPFINCVDCGPRFTVIESLPYDRERTSMRSFVLCAECRAEYEDPEDRRFHAEPMACPACGPRVRLFADGARTQADPVPAAAEILREGGVLAVKGLGGFHLACDATSEDAVRRLRERKRRPRKPFAVMVASESDLGRWFEPTETERKTLGSWRAPIVLVADRGELAPSVAPGHLRHGAMLPSTPLHHLLTREAGVPLVMTSGNASDEPICIEDADALERLAPIADAFLLHDRPIVARYDDSVVLLRRGERDPSALRRARSFAPHPIALARPVRSTVLGTGAELHGAFCVAAGSLAYLSQHVGDLVTDQAMGAYRAALDRACRVFELRPEVVAHDLHPDLLTTRFAEELGLPRVAVQHHHAHVVATMAEHGLEGDVIGIAFDGLGLGEDGTIWGGEFLRCSASHSNRIGRLRPVRQPGGDVATANPWRMALAHAEDAEMLDDAKRYLLAPDDEAWNAARAQARSGLVSPLTSSAGRLFDALAALLGICERSTYDGQAAIELEQIADRDALAVPVELAERDGLLEVDTRDLVRAAIRGRRRGVDVGELAGAFHASFSEATAAAALRLAEGQSLERVVLGGGVFANDLLTARIVARLTGEGLQVFLPREIPVGDGGIALGQAVVAAQRERVLEVT